MRARCKEQIIRCMHAVIFSLNSCAFEFNSYVFRPFAFSVLTYGVFTLGTLAFEPGAFASVEAQLRSCRSIFSEQIGADDLSDSAKRAIKMYLAHQRRDHPELDSYWNEYLRYRNNGNNNGASNSRTRSVVDREWFFPEGDIGAETQRFMDIESLGFGNGFRGATIYRVRKLLRAPLTDVRELRTRQGAIAELMMPESDLFRQLTAILGKKETTRWKRTFFYDEESHHPEPETAAVLYRTSGEEDCHQALRSGKQPSDLIDFAKNNMERRKQFFKDARETIQVLENADLKSLRFRQLRWLLQSIARDSGHGTAGEWIRELTTTTDLLKHEDLIEMAETRRRRHEEGDDRRKGAPGDLREQIRLFIEAYSELMMYVELAQHSFENRWTTFPEILDPKETGHPVLTIVNGHTPRVLLEKRDEAVHKSIELGIDSKRHVIITGPNAQGKTTAVRMVAQLLTLAQMGLPVPAQSMKLTPLGLIVYLHPKDNPAKGDSLFMAEARELWQGVYRRAAMSPYQIVIMDEIAPGTIQEVREDFERIFLQALDQTGVLSMTATHNLGTTELAEKFPPFFNMHVENHHLLHGTKANLPAMYEAAARALIAVGVSDEVVKTFLAAGKQREEQK